MCQAIRERAGSVWVFWRLNNGAVAVFFKCPVASESPNLVFPDGWPQCLEFAHAVWDEEEKCPGGKRTQDRVVG